MHWTQTARGRKFMRETAKKRFGHKLKGRRKYHCSTCNKDVVDSYYHRKQNPGHQLERIPVTVKDLMAKRRPIVLGNEKGAKYFRQTALDKLQDNALNEARELAAGLDKLPIQISYAAGYIQSWLEWYAKNLGIVAVENFRTAVLETIETKGGK